MSPRLLFVLVLLAAPHPSCNPEAALLSSSSAGGGTNQVPVSTVQLSGVLFGRGYHRGNCNNIGNTFQPRFTTRADGRADLTLTFSPIAGQQLSLGLDPSPRSGSVVQGAGPTLQASFDVAGGTEYVVRICVPVGPGLDPGPFDATLAVTHP